MSVDENTRLVAGNQKNFRSLEENLEITNGYDSEKTSAPYCASCCKDFMKSFVFGAFDGLVASLAVVSACAGAGLSAKVLVVIGFAILSANCVHVGISEYLSSKAHKEFLQAEKRRELWEFKHYKDGEINEMVNRFEARGMARKDAELVVSKMAQYENFFVGLMVAEELGLQIPEGEDSELITDAFIMFFSFGVFGSIPLLLHLLGNYNSFADSDLFMISAVVSLFLLSSLGMVKSTFSNASLLYSAFEALALGVICIALAYITGALLLDLIEP